MIIDCHTHIGRNDNITASVTELLRSMDTAAIDKAFVFANKIGDASNEYMLEQIAPHRDRLYGVAAIHPGTNWMDMMSDRIDDWYCEGKIVAVKFYTGYDHWYPKDTFDHLNRLQTIGCPAIFHMGDCHSSCGKTAKLKYAHPLLIDEVAVDYPGINFIIAHMGFPWVRDTAQVCVKNDNVYTDVSGFVYGSFSDVSRMKFRKEMESFQDICPDSKKLLFGTDWPISDQSSYHNSMSYIHGVDVLEMTDSVIDVFKLKDKRNYSQDLA